MFKLVLTPLFLGIGFYLYFFIKRIVKTLSKKDTSKKEKIIIAISAVILSLFCYNISGLYTVTILHIVAISSILMFINFSLKKIFSNKYKKGFAPWKMIYGSGALAFIITFVLLTAGYVNMHNVIKTQYAVYTQKNVRSNGYRIALLADIHFGVSLDEKDLSNVCERVSKENVDAVILCGDIVDDNTTKDQVKKVFDILGKIKSNNGIFYVFGNHDRPFSMVSSDYTEEDLVTSIESNGIIILKDKAFFINDELYLIGRDDRGFDNHKRESIEALLNKVDKEGFILTIDHQPTEYTENGKAGTDLLLSGHTHGGQLWPVNLIDKLFKINDANYGFTKIDENTNAIVTSGVAGWAYPVKTSAPSEYVIINIYPEKK